MLDKLFIFLEETSEYVPADELGDYFWVFAGLVIFLAVLPWLFLIIYTIFLRKFRIRYFVDDKLVYEIKYKKNKPIAPYQYEQITTWYLDQELTKPFDLSVMPDYNLKVYAKKIEEKENE